MEKIDINHSSSIGEARRVSSALCREVGLSENSIAKCAIIVTEFATNLSKYASSGFILLQSYEIFNRKIFEILSIDHGPGIGDTKSALIDGYSSSGTYGEGLGAVKRLSDVFDVFSVPGKGTIIMARVMESKLKEIPANKNQYPFDVAAINFPLYPKEPSGDSWTILEKGNRVIALVADGLGHGPEASWASYLAVTICRENLSEPLDGIMKKIHNGLTSTRGAVIGIAEIYFREGRVKYCGIGNITAKVIYQDTARLFGNMNGTVGAQIPKIEISEYPWGEDNLLIMHSDGLICHWNLSDYGGLRSHHPAIIASVLYRDYCRKNDDLAIIVLGKWRME